MPFLHKIICSAWNKTNALLGFSLICYSSNYLDNTTFWNAKLGLSNPSLVKCGDHVIQRWARIRTGSDWIRTETNFGRSRTGSDRNFFGSWRIRTGSDCENFCCFDLIILNLSKIFLVIRFHRFGKWQCIFCHHWQKLWSRTWKNVSPNTSNGPAICYCTRGHYRAGQRWADCHILQSSPEFLKLIPSPTIVQKV